MNMRPGEKDSKDLEKGLEGGNLGKNKKGSSTSFYYEPSLNS